MVYKKIPTNFYQLWLIICALMVVLMFVIGAITRLTDSGLSMVEWQPISGIMPPLTHQEWQNFFELYQQTSQFQLRNHDFALSDFQQIFWWEYIHRLWGRLIGMIFIAGLVINIAKKNINPDHHKFLWALLGLGLLQGFIGWWMVKSGFIDRTEVSQYRLAIHLAMALSILMLNITLIAKNMNYHLRFNLSAILWFLLIFFMIISGALVAGLRGGFVHNDFPLMNGQFFPIDYWQFAGFWQNWGENPIAAQFNHRIIAYIIGILAIIHYFCQRTSANLLFLLAIFGQILLGILILLFYVPISLAALHQLGAIGILTLAFLKNFEKK